MNLYGNCVTSNAKSLPSTRGHLSYAVSRFVDRKRERSDTVVGTANLFWNWLGIQSLDCLLDKIV